MECVVIVPSVSFETQVAENNKEIILKKLSTEIIMGKTTEDTAMELDAEGGASFEQLQDLIKKDVINGIRNTVLWNKNTTNYRTHSTANNRTKLTNEGPTRRLEQKEIINGKSSTGPKPTWPPNNKKREPHMARPRSLAGRQGKADDINKDTTNDNPIESKGIRRSRSRQKKKPSTTDRSKLRLQSQTK